MFSVKNLDGEQLALEVLGPDGAWRLPLRLEQAEFLGKELLEFVDELKQQTKISRLKQYINEVMLDIPVGKFWMGSEPNRTIADDELPRHQVHLSQSIEMNRLVVSQALYQMVTGENPSFFLDPQNPVEAISWFDAIRFCNQLSELLNLQPCYEINGQTVYWYRDRNGYRLPTEAEWEYVARANQNVRFSGGASLDLLAWVSKNSQNQINNIGLKDPNNWGLYDMSGLVFEWCWDWYGPYTGVKEIDPVGPEDGQQRVCRGGAWNRDGWFARVSCRASEIPISRCSNIGFRFCRTKEPGL